MSTGRVPVILYLNCQEPQDEKLIYISQVNGINDLYKQASQALGIQCTKIYDESGRQVTSVLVIKEQQILFASQGESYAVVDKSGIKKRNQTTTVKISIMGAAAVGKSALAWRYTQNEFREYYDPTISDTYQKNQTIDGKQVTVEILDTAGMEDYQPLEDDWINNKDGILLVYSVDIESSLHHLRNIWDKIRSRYFSMKMPTVVLVGNKIDLKRNVTPEQAQALADEFGIRHFETSACTNYQISELFSYIVGDVLNNRSSIGNPTLGQSSQCCTCSIF